MSPSSPREGRPAAASTVRGRAKTTTATPGAGRAPRTGARRTVLYYIQQLPAYLRLLGGLITDPRVAMLDKLLVAGAMAYIVMPLDLIPDFIPFIGEVDDVFILVLALQRLVSNADNFDKAILTYSAAGLALSLGFLKDFVPVTEASLSWLLYGSWALFVLAVLFTLLSYLTSQRAQHRQLDISAKYNLEMKDEALNEVNWPARLTEWGSYGAGTCFVFAIVGSTLFVALNLNQGPKVATTTRGTGRDGAPAPIIQRVQTVELTRGAPVPTIQAIPQTQPIATTSSPAPAPTTTPAPASGSK